MITGCELSGYTVTNDEAFTDGADFEEDEEYRVRLLEFVRADNFGSKGYYENILLSIPGIHDILANSNPSASIDYYLNTNDSSIANSVYNTVLAYFTDNNNIVVGHSYNFQLSKLHNVSFTITVNADCGYSESDLKDFFECYFKGGTLQNYPLDYQGLSMGDEISSSDLTTELTGYFTDIDSATISSISNTYGESSSTSFDFIATDETHSAYSLGTVTVVFS